MGTRRRFVFAMAGGAIAGVPALASDEDFGVFTEAPRLLLRPQRLRLLRRERERQSMRWQQFDLIIGGKAPLPEPGFALALYYQVSGNKGVGARAIEWATTATDLRQVALVYDWCQPLLEPKHRQQLEEKLDRILRAAELNDVAAMRTRVFAAIATSEKKPDHGAAVMGDVVTKWWRGAVVPGLKSGRESVGREQFLPLYELLHAVRDNINIDLREDAGAIFREFPTYYVVSDYPATYPAGENQFRIPSAKDAEPNLTRAALSRAAGLSMVGFDTNALESQYLQGWLMQDRFAMRGALGAPYEFLWANPYQPGLSYHHLPLVWHDSQTGRLFARSHWDEDATWVGFFDRQMQWFEDGRVRAFKPSIKPQAVGPAIFLSGAAPMKFQVDEEEPATLFLMGLEPRTVFDVEVDDQELQEAASDAGGVLALHFPSPIRAGVRIRKTPVARGSVK